MQRVSIGLALGLVLALCIGVSAGPSPLVKENLATTDLSSTAIDSTAYTGWIQVPQHRCVALEIDYTNSSATAVTMSCETSDVSSTSNGSGFDLQKIEDSSTAFTSDSDGHTWSQAVSGDEKWTWSVCNLPHEWINCWFDGTSADASDTVTVKHIRSYP